jgi:small conductance mechanosensitive channel
MVDVSGQVGRVEKVGLRFTELRNFYNQQVFLSNRNIANIARFPRGGIHAYVDVQMPASADRSKVITVVKEAAQGMREQFPAIILREPDVSDLQTAKAGMGEFVRVEFKLWPGQGALVETTFRQRLVTLLKQFDPNYADWMVVITYRATDLAQTDVSI